MEYQRIFQSDPLPKYGNLRKFIGKAKSSFDEIIDFLDKNYDFQKEIFFGGKNYGVMVRYRKDGKTLIQIFPEKDGFEVVLIYGKKEREAFESRKKEFSKYLVDIYNNTKQYHDGKWMLIRVKNSRYNKELIEMIKIKKKTKKLIKKV